MAVDCDPLPGGDLIVFDAASVFCSGLARFMHRQDHAGRCSFVSAQSATGRALYQDHGLDPDLLETNILITHGRAHVKIPAFAAAKRALEFPFAIPSVRGMLPDWL